MDIRTWLAVAAVIFAAGGWAEAFRRTRRDVNGLGERLRQDVNGLGARQRRFEKRVIEALLTKAEKEEDRKWISALFHDT